MFLKKLDRFAAAVMSVIFAVGIMCFNTAASPDSCSLFIPVTVNNKTGTVSQGATFTVEIEGIGSSPLPEKTSVVTKASDKVNIGPIVFDEPGDYKYTIREKKHSDKRIVTDDTVYNVSVCVLYDSSGELTCGYSLTRQDNGQKPANVSFINSGEDVDGGDASETVTTVSQKPSPPPATAPVEDKPQTGAVLSYAFPAVLLPLLVIIAIVVRRSEKKENSKSPPGNEQEE